MIQIETITRWAVDIRTIWISCCISFMHLIQAENDNSIANIWIALHLIWFVQCAVLYDCVFSCWELNSHINLSGHRIDDMNWIYIFNLANIRLIFKGKMMLWKKIYFLDTYAPTLSLLFRATFSIGISEKWKILKQFEWQLLIAVIANVSFNFPVFPRNIFLLVIFNLISFISR